MRRVLRYGVVDVYLVIVYTLTFLLLILALVSKQKDEYLSIDQNNLESGYQSRFQIVTNEGVLDFSDITIEESVFSTLSNVQVSLDKSGETTEAYVIIGGTELFPATIIKGNLPNENGCYAVIGRALQSTCEREDGKDFVRIDGCRYQVAAVVGARNSEAEDYLLYLWYDGLGKNTRRHIENNSELNLQLIGEEKSVLAAADTMKETLSRQHPECTYIENHGVFSLDTTMGDDTQEYFMLYAFCIVNSIVATELWVYVRKREIAVRKAYGFSGFLCFLHFYIENMKLGAISAVVSFLVVCGIGYWRTQTFRNAMLFVRCLPEFLLLFLGTMFLSLGIYIVRAHLASSMDALIQEGSKDDD